MIGYHVSAARNRDSITARGLLRDGGGWDAGYVWFFLDARIAAQAAAGRAWGGGAGGNDVWLIDLDGLGVLPDPHAGWGDLKPGWDDAARAVATSIPPDRLRLSEPAMIVAR